MEAAAAALGPAESDRSREQRAFETALDEAEDLIRDALNTARRRVYFHLCSVLPDMDEGLRLDADGFGAERQRRKAKEPAAPVSGEAPSPEPK